MRNCYQYDFLSLLRICFSANLNEALLTKEGRFDALQDFSKVPGRPETGLSASERKTRGSRPWRTISSCKCDMRIGKEKSEKLSGSCACIL